MVGGVLPPPAQNQALVQRPRSGLRPFEEFVHVEDRCFSDKLCPWGGLNHNTKAAFLFKCNPARALSPSFSPLVFRVHLSLALAANNARLAQLLPAATAAGTTLMVPPRDATVMPPPCRWDCAPSARAKACGWRQGRAPARWWFSTRGGQAVGRSFGGTPTAGRLSGSSTLRGEHTPTGGRLGNPGFSVLCRFSLHHPQNVGFVVLIA